jgi:hypothetical protein
MVLGLMCFFLNDFDVCLNSHRWFMLCMVYISHLVLVLVSGVDSVHLRESSILRRRLVRVL